MFKIPKSNQMKTTAPDPQPGSNLRWGTEDAPLSLSSHFNASGVVTWGHRLERREQEETLKTHHRGSKVHPPGPPRAWSGESFKANNSRGGAVSTRPAIGPLMRAHCLPLSLCLSVCPSRPSSLCISSWFHPSLPLSDGLWSQAPGTAGGLLLSTSPGHFNSICHCWELEWCMCKMFNWTTRQIHQAVL